MATASSIEIEAKESTQKWFQVKRPFSYGIPLNLLSPKTVDPFCGASKLKFAKPFKIVLDIRMKNDYSKFHRDRSNRKYLKVGPTEISGEERRRKKERKNQFSGHFWQFLTSHKIRSNRNFSTRFSATCSFWS